MATALARIIKYGFQSFWRNKWLSAATIAVLMLALVVFGGLIISSFLTKSALNLLKDKIDFSVYFNTDVSEDEILKIRKSLASLAEVKSVDYVSRDEAMKSFQERHKDDEIVNQALIIVEENPLHASLNIKATDLQEYPAISAFLNNPDFQDKINQVNFAQNERAINKMARIVDVINQGGVALTTILSVIAVLVTLNTIMLTIYSTRDEIGIMRLVGASNHFIRGPYIMQGVLYGVTAALLSLVLLAPVVYFANPYTEILMPGLDLQGYFYGNLFNLLLYQVALGVILGSVSSGIAVARYLKV